MGRLLAFAVLAVTSVALPLWPCGAATDEGVLRYSVASDPGLLDWAQKNEFMGDMLLMFNMMEGLVQLNSEGQPVPALASSWEALDGGRSFVFHLRKDVVWSDGKPLTAGDFVFAWRRVLDPATKSGYAFFLNDIENAPEFRSGQLKNAAKLGVTATDDHTLLVKLRRPMRHFASFMYFYITFPQRADLIKKYGKRAFDPDKVVTLGPYRIAARRKGHELTLERNAHYYGEVPKVAKVRVLIEKDLNKRAELAAAAQIDIVQQASNAQIKTLLAREELGWRRADFPGLNVMYLGFNLATALGGNLRYRRALAMAINPNEIAGKMPDEARPAVGLVPVGLPEFAPAGLGYDVKKAHDELASLDRKVTFLYPARHSGLGFAVRDALVDHLGLLIRAIEVGDGEDFRARLRQTGAELFLSGWAADIPDATGFFQMLESDSGFNLMGWRDSGFDQAVRAAEGSAELTRRKQVLHEAQSLALEKAVVLVPLVHKRNTFLLSPRIAHFELFPTLAFFYIKQIELGASKSQ
ncbi:MAG: peptide ABC transporter substrate-binding protein [Deltaproteobacteria bacterium]|nr:peptide ABC transporter substrate-binding protein [Deltaproteobacteria bacterium]